MLRNVLLGLVLLPTLATAATPAGRWQGIVDIPGRPLALVVDIAQDGDGRWIGSVIVPALGVKGAPLANVTRVEDGVAFDLGRLLASPAYGPAQFTARLQADGAMIGEMRQAGNLAPLTLTRTGPAQVEPPVRSTPVAADVAHAWRGDFELTGYPRHVTLTFENHAGGGATATLIVVGKATTTVPIDLVVQEGANVRIESQAMGIAFEGRLDDAHAELQGAIEVGPIERPLVLRRERAS